MADVVVVLLLALMVVGAEVRWWPIGVAVLLVLFLAGVVALSRGDG